VLNPRKTISNEIHPLQLQFEEPLMAILKASTRFDNQDTASPMWKTPTASPEHFESYVLFLKLLRNLKGHFQAHQDGVTTSKEKGLSEKGGVPHPDYYLLQAITLVDCAAGQECKVSQSKVAYVEPFMPLFEELDDNINLSERRKTMLSKWLKSLCLTIVEC
jgi:hypothetical protein